MPCAVKPAACWCLEVVNALCPSPGLLHQHPFMSNRPPLLCKSFVNARRKLAHV